MLDAHPIPLHPRFKDLTGKTFGLLMVRSYGGIRQFKYQGHAVWNCLCACGNEKQMMAANLAGGYSQSCGCESVKAAKKHKTHGGSYTPEYGIWSGMLARCYRKNDKRFRFYGGRGITVCERWRGKEGFANFLADVGLRPSSSHSIDRFPDKTGNYEPSNVRWATAKQQARNTRKNCLYTFCGQTLCVSEWAEIIGITAWALSLRLKRYPPEIALGHAKAKKGKRLSAEDFAGVNSAIAEMDRHFASI